MRNQDASYNDDIYEWIIEAVKEMNTSFAMSLNTCQIQIKDYVACIPSDYESVELIAYQGCKLREGAPVPTFQNYFDYSKTGFTSEAVPNRLFYLEEDQEIDGRLIPAGYYTDAYRNAENKIYRTHYDEIAMNYYRQNLVHCYWIKGGYLRTTMKEGVLDFTYYAYPQDSEGYPMVLDHPNYEKAIYFYVVRQMMESGFKHPLYKNDFMIVQELYTDQKRKALHDIEMITPDRMESVYQGLTRLVTVNDAWETNFRTLPLPESLDTRLTQI